MSSQYNYKPFSEAELEQAIVQLFEGVGYIYQKADTLNRQNSDVILKDDLEEYIRREYSDEHLTENEIETIMERIIRCGSYAGLYDNSKETYYLVTRGFDLQRDDISLDPITIKYIDFDNVSNNTFKVVNQYVVEGSVETRIPDLVVFVNGIPVSIWEFKSALKEDKTIHDAWEQINIRYARAIDNLLQFCFLSVISDGANTRLGTVMTDYEYYYAWNRIDEGRKENENVTGIKSLEYMIKGAFAPDRILDILRNFVYYPETTEQNPVPIVCRYPQYFGAKLMAKNVIEHIKIGDGKGGTYFGAMGCGKTYTMLFMAQLLKRKYASETKNPTIILIEDRDDLDDQTIKVFKDATVYLEDKDVRSFESREDLRNTLMGKKQKNEGGGVYVTTIQKFCKTENNEILSDRENIICISDEAHRTQLNLEEKEKYYEDRIVTTTGFGKILRDSLPNAVYCGFTGTPIDETIAVFGDIVDRYTMSESVRDGITVDITYVGKELSDLTVNNEIEEANRYYNECLEKGSTEEQVEASKRAMSRISTIYSRPKVLHELAKDIVEHYEKMCSEKPDVVQKAMIVCADRSLAYNIYTEIRNMRPDWVEKRKADDRNKFTKDEYDDLPNVAKLNLVITREPNDKKEMYDLAGTRDSRKQLATDFKNEKSNFKIAIVSDMWITGFDVLPLRALYLIKPVQKHQLIQTISRVNRVWAGKDYGIVVDFMKLKNQLDEALKMYSNPDDFQIKDVSVIVDSFRRLLEEASLQMLGFDSSKFFDKDSAELDRLSCLNDAVDYVQRSKATQDEFMDTVLQLKRTYDTALYAEENKLKQEEIAEANFYLAIRSLIYKETKGDAPDTEIMNKHVEEIIDKALNLTGLSQVFEEKHVVDLFNDEGLEAIRNAPESPTKINALARWIEAATSSYERISLVKSQEFSDMLQKTIDDYYRETSQKTVTVSAGLVTEITERLYDIIEKIKIDGHEFQKMGISREEKSYYDILIDTKKRYSLVISDNDCLEMAKEIKKIVDEERIYTDWLKKSDSKNTIKRKVTQLLSRYNFSLAYRDDIFEKLINQLAAMK